MKTRHKTNGKVEILIAEDSPTQAAQLTYLLEQHDYKVTAATHWPCSCGTSRPW